MDCPACREDNIPGADLCANCGLDLAGLDIEAWGVDPEDPILLRTLGELPLKEARCVDVDSTVNEAIELMTKSHEGCVFVERDGAVVGVFTERDVTARVAAPGRDPELTTVSEVMTDRPVTLQKGDPLSWAMHRMGVDGHRHLAVTDEERLCGFLSMRTILRVLNKASETNESR